MHFTVLFSLLLSLDENVFAHAVAAVAVEPVGEAVALALAAAVLVGVAARTEVVAHAVPAAVQNVVAEHAAVVAAQNEAVAEQGRNRFVDVAVAAVLVAEAAQVPDSSVAAWLLSRYVVDASRFAVRRLNAGRFAMALYAEQDFAACFPCLSCSVQSDAEIHSN